MDLLLSVEGTPRQTRPITRPRRHTKLDYADQRSHKASSRDGTTGAPRHNRTGGIRPLMLNSALAAFLDEAGVVEDQHPVAVAELLDDVLAHVVTDPVNVPVRPPQQPLHPVRRHLASPFGQRPAVLALQPGDQPMHVLPRTGPRLRAGEPARDTDVQPIQLGHGKTDHHRQNDRTRRSTAVAVLRVGAWSTGNMAKNRLGEAAIDTDVLPGDITR
jgi:hypothetical protein